MKLQAATIQLYVRLRRNLAPQMPAQSKPAETFQNLNRAESQQGFEQTLGFVRLDFGKRFAMAQSFEVGEAARYEWICGDEPIVNHLAVDRFKRSRLLCCKNIMLEQGQSRIAEQIIHAETLS